MDRALFANIRRELGQMLTSLEAPDGPGEVTTFFGFDRNIQYTVTVDDQARTVICARRATDQTDRTRDAPDLGSLQSYLDEVGEELGYTVQMPSAENKDQGTLF